MNIATVNERIYIMVVMQLSVSIDYPFFIATFSNVYINLISMEKGEMYPHRSSLLSFFGPV
jgi:hypothetical protein